MQDYEAQAKILKAVGREVVFGERHGTLQERVVIQSNFPYWDVVDLIWFPDDGQEWMRIGWYKAEGDRLKWADKTAICEPISIWRKILLQTARQKSWFRQLLEEVVDELRRT